MNEYSEALLQAFRITAQSELNKFKYDKTVQSKILSIIDISKGEYEVEYQNNRITAYSLDLEKTYKTDENVLIKIPEGDLSNKIIIEGRVSAININSLTLNKLRNSFYPVGQSFFNSNGIVKLKAFKDKEEEVSGEVELDKESELNVTECEYLQIKAEFQTRFFGKHSTGNYGLIINFSTKDNSTYTVLLNSSDFIGDFYNFHQWTEQSKIISIPKNLISKISSIYFVCENFKIDEECKCEDLKDENLLCRNIEICFMNKVDLLEGGYYLYLQTPQGKFFNSDTTSLNIVANLLVNGENITNQSGCELKWEKLSLTEGNNNGWIKLKNTKNSYIVEKEEVGVYSATYRVTASYKDIITSQEITLYGINYLNAPKIIQTMDNKNIKLSLPTGIKGKWFCLLSNGEYKQIDKDDGEKEFIILEKKDLLYDNMKFYCQIDNNYVASIVLSKPQTTEDVTASFVGQDVYKYDANGAITQEDSEMRRTLNFNAIFKEGIAYNYSIKWYLGDIELSKDSISPDNSMLDNVLVDKSGILFYNIRQKYKREYTNNTIRVELTATNNKTYTFEKAIIFTKDGDQGTNGTSYVLRVFPIDNNGNEISGLWGLSSNSNSRGKLKAKLLKNGKDIEETNIVFNWEEVAKNNINSAERNSSIIEVKSNENKECIVQVTARCQGMSISNIYGVNILTSDNNISNYDISSIPNVIRYNSDGGNPSINSGEYKYIYNKETKSVDITVPTNIFALEKRYQTITMDGLNHPIIYHTNRYGNEAINSWDGTTIETKKNGAILAPQIGAGIKDSDNSFTGFVIGKNTGNDNKVGLYGYSKGEQTFLLDEKGKARFGKDDQHAIVIDGNEAVIKGGTMTINLNGSGDDIAIKAGNAFTVDYNGKLTASSANITGKITATSGSIGGWKIDGNNIQCGDTILYADTQGTGAGDYTGVIKSSIFQISDVGYLGIRDTQQSNTVLDIVANPGNSLVLRSSVYNNKGGFITLDADKDINLIGREVYINGQTLESYIQDIVRPMIPTTGE